MLLLSVILILITVLPPISSNNPICENYSNSHLSKVPQDGISPTSRCLNLSVNDIYKLNSDSLRRYPYLKKLSLERNKIKSISPDAFSYQNDLTDLNLADNERLENLTNLPSSLESLSLSGCASLKIKGVNWSDLKSLKILKLRDAKLKEFPKLADVGSSLEELDIRSNPELTKFDVPDLAPLCKLKILHISQEEDGSVDNDDFTMDGDLCNCRAVQQWIKQYDIKGPNITCAEAGNCEYPIDLETFKSTRNKCNYASIWRRYWIWGAGIFLTVLCVTCCCFICRRLKCNQTSSLDEESEGVKET